MKIGIVQFKPLKGNISANSERHLALIEKAGSLNTDAVFFPELSLTGYEPELAKELAISQNDKRLDIFQQKSDVQNITIGLGIPTLTQSGICISMVIFQPEQPRQIYSKQQLHADEFPYFENGHEQLVLTVGNKKISPAICYESLQPDHAAHACELGTDIYLASVAKSQKGISTAYTHYPGIAKQYSIPVLMTNSVGYCDNFLSVGQSAVWSENGLLLAQLNDIEEGVIVFDTDTEKVSIFKEAT